jgi:hypothetical protein
MARSLFVNSRIFRFVLINTLLVTLSGSSIRKPGEVAYRLPETFVVPPGLVVGTRSTAVNSVSGSTEPLLPTRNMAIEVGEVFKLRSDLEGGIEANSRTVDSLTQRRVKEASKMAQTKIILDKIIDCSSVSISVLFKLPETHFTMLESNVQQVKKGRISEQALADFLSAYTDDAKCFLIKQLLAKHSHSVESARLLEERYVSFSKFLTERRDSIDVVFNGQVFQENFNNMQVMPGSTYDWLKATKRVMMLRSRLEALILETNKVKTMRHNNSARNTMTAADEGNLKNNLVRLMGYHFHDGRDLLMGTQDSVLVTYLLGEISIWKVGDVQWQVKHALDHYREFIQRESTRVLNMELDMLAIPSTGAKYQYGSAV